MTPASMIPTTMGWAIAGGGRAANVAAGTRYAGTTSQLCGLFPFAVASGATLTGVPLGRSLSAADTLPFLLIPALHHVEAWNEAVCAGAWGERLVPVGERIRRAIDLEHWAAFNESFRRMENLLTEVASGRRGRPPATIVGIGGDVHHAYLAEVGFPREAHAESAVYQAVCSPFRNALDSHERSIVRNAQRPAMERLLRPLARAAGVPDPRVRWRLVQAATFDNQFATLELEGRSAVLRIERTVRDEADNRSIETSLERRLA